VKSLLVVDDTAVIRKAVRLLLKGKNIEVNEVTSGEEALSYLTKSIVDKKIPDGILLDIDMPGINGISTLKLIKSKPSYASIKVLMCSTRNSKKMMQEAMSAGAFDYIIKPFNADTLSTKLNHAALL